MVNPLDLAPQYSSIILGISNTIATIPGILSPLLTGHIVTEKFVSKCDFQKKKKTIQ
jgi:ACS family sodium-dependent inorganic phosphate cotransporter